MDHAMEYFIKEVMSGIVHKSIDHDCRGNDPLSGCRWCFEAQEVLAYFKKMDRLREEIVY